MSEQWFQAEVGRRIRRARRAADMSQAKVGEYLGGVATSYICEIEKGRRPIQGYVIFRLEKLFGERLMP